MQQQPEETQRRIALIECTISDQLGGVIQQINECLASQDYFPLKELLDKFYSLLSEIEIGLRTIIVSELPDAGIPRLDQEMLERYLHQIRTKINFLPVN